MSDKKKIIALFGKSGSGKDAICKWITANREKYNLIVPFTTRPKRKGEINGIDYIFICDDTFKTMKKNKENFVTTTCFNNWYYGKTYNSFVKDKINVGVFNIEEIKELLNKENLFEVYPIYIKCQDRTRLERCLNRERFPDCSEICRRFLTDEKDFQEIKFSHYIYDNSDNYKDYKENLKIDFILLDKNR